MRCIVLLGLLLWAVCSGCAAGAATAGYSLGAKTADGLSAPARQSIIDEVKEWVRDNFEKKK